MALWHKLVMQLPRLFANAAARVPARPANRFRPAVAALEDRTVPATDLFLDAAAGDALGGFVNDTSSNFDATGDAGEIDLDSGENGQNDGGGNPDAIHSLWWKYTADQDGFIEVNTAGSDFDTILGVYADTDGTIAGLTQVAVNDDADASTLQSRVVFQATANTTYYFTVDGKSDAAGSVHLRAGAVPPPNDNLAAAGVVNGDWGPEVGYNMGATGEAGEPAAGVNGAVNSVWWRWTAAQSGPATIDTHGSSFDTILAVYSGNGTIPGLSLVGVSNGQGGTAVSFNAVAGTTYYISVEGNGDEYGFIMLSAPPGLVSSNSPPSISAATFSVNENSPAGTVVGTPTASDPDAGQTLTYSILSGNTSGAFAINSATGQITVANAAALNYEATQSFDLVVQVTDSASPSLSDSAIVRVNVGNVNEAPVFAPGGTFGVAENTPVGTVAGKVSASDPDAGQTLTYSITAGNTSGAFAINPTTGEITVANPAAINYEAAHSFSLTVRATDNGTGALYAARAVVVNIADVNEAPVLDTSGSMSLGGVTQGATNNGTLVSDLLASAGGNRISDQDGNAKQGIAVIAADTAHGSWQFTTNGGGTWTNLGGVSGTSARLLAADANTRVRFVPTAGYSGSVATALSFRAWDQTSGANGGVANVGGVGEGSTDGRNGGGSAFSTAVETASIGVAAAPSPVKDFLTKVQSLLGSTKLASSKTAPLVSLLTTADQQLASGNKLGAVSSMLSFITKVPSVVTTGGLSAAQGVDLILRATALTVSILL